MASEALLVEIAKAAPEDSPGKGVLRCRICDKPYVEHQMKPCPELGMDIIASAPLRGSGSVQEGKRCVRCGKDARRRKNGSGWTKYCSDNCRKNR